MLPTSHHYRYKQTTATWASPEYSWIVLRCLHMTRMWNLCCYSRQSRSSEIIIHVQNIWEQRLRGGFLDIKLLHFLGHHDCLPGDLLAWPSHLEEPREPLQEDDSNLQSGHNWRIRLANFHKRQNFVNSLFGWQCISNPCDVTLILTQSGIWCVSAILWW